MKCDCFRKVWPTTVDFGAVVLVLFLLVPGLFAGCVSETCMTPKVVPFIHQIVSDASHMMSD